LGRGEREKGRRDARVWPAGRGGATEKRAGLSEKKGKGREAGLASFAGAGFGAGCFFAGAERWFVSWGFSRRLGGFAVFDGAELIGGLQGAGQDVLGGGGETDMSHAHAAPAAGNGEKDIGEFFDEGFLLLKGEHQVSVALFGGGEGGKDAAADTEIWLAHMRGFFSAREAESDATEVVEVHGGMVARGCRKGKEPFGAGVKGTGKRKLSLTLREGR
jgi:hypothetical protein